MGSEAGVVCAGSEGPALGVPACWPQAHSASVMARASSRAVEVAGAIAEKLGLELVIDDMGFDPALLAVQEGVWMGDSSRTMTTCTPVA